MPARVVRFPVAQPRDQLAVLGEVLEQRPSGEQHQLIERALHVRAPSSDALPEPVEVSLDAASARSTGSGPNTRPANSRGFQPAERVVQVPLVAEQVGDRGDRLAVVAARAARRLQPLVAVPAPEREPVLSRPGEQQRPSRERPHHSGCDVDHVQRVVDRVRSAAPARGRSLGHRYRCSASCAGVSRSARSARRAVIARGSSQRRPPAARARSDAAASAVMRAPRRAARSAPGGSASSRSQARSARSRPDRWM